METHTLTPEVIEELFNQSDTRVLTAFGTTTIVATKLPSGFVITESFSAPTIDEYDLDIGIQECTDRICKRIWDYEMYSMMFRSVKESALEKTNDGGE